MVNIKLVMMARDTATIITNMIIVDSIPCSVDQSRLREQLICPD